MEFYARFTAFIACFTLLLMMLYVFNRKPKSTGIRWHLCRKHLVILRQGEMAAIDDKNCMRCHNRTVDIELLRRVRSKKRGNV